MFPMACKDRLSGIFIILFSGIAVYLALKLPMGRVGKPGPGIFPLILSTVIGLLGLALCSKTLRSKKELGTEEVPITKWRLAYLLGDLFLYAFLLRPLGFLISTWVFLLVLKPIVEKRWILVVLGSSFISVALFFFFKYLLKVELPMGILAK
jgi:hypothetical protein